MNNNRFVKITEFQAWSMLWSEWKNKDYQSAKNLLYRNTHLDIFVTEATLTVKKWKQEGVIK